MPTYLSAAEKGKLIGLAKGGDLLAQAYVDHELALDNIRAGKEGFLFTAKVATTANHALTGLTAIDGVTPVAGDIIFARAQSSTIENGLYVAASGAWSRLKDAELNHVMKPGMLISVQQGTAKADTLWLVTSNSFTVGTDAIAVTELNVTTLAVSLAAVTNGNGASLIGIEDAAGLITAANVEAALLEIVSRLGTVALADPGDAGAIAVTRSGSCALTSGGAETRTLAIPTFKGQRLSIYCDTYVGDIVITSAQALNQAGNNTMTLGAARDTIELVAITVGGALRWEIMATNGTVALSTV